MRYRIVAMLSRRSAFSAPQRQGPVPLAHRRTCSNSSSSRRTITSFSPFRPSPFLARARPALPYTPTAGVPPPAPSTAAAGALDLLPKISAHPALAAQQVRCGPRPTYDPSHFVRKRRHGFLSRLRTRKGRATLRRRRLKGRKSLSH